MMTKRATAIDGTVEGFDYFAADCDVGAGWRVVVVSGLGEAIFADGANGGGYRKKSKTRVTGTPNLRGAIRFSLAFKKNNSRPTKVGSY